MSTVTNFLDFTINAALHLTFIRKLCYKTVEYCNLYIHSDFFSKLCLLFWIAAELPRLLDTASKFALFSVSGLKDEKLINKANVHKNWNMQTLFYGLLNISAKFHQNWSLQFWAIPFQIWCVFWDTVYIHPCSSWPGRNSLSGSICATQLLDSFDQFRRHLKILRPFGAVLFRIFVNNTERSFS